MKQFEIEVEEVRGHCIYSYFEIEVEEVRGHCIYSYAEGDKFICNGLFTPNAFCGGAYTTLFPIILALNSGA